MLASALLPRPRLLIPSRIGRVAWLAFFSCALFLHPHASPASPPPTVLKNLVYGQADGHDLKLDLYRPPIGDFAPTNAPCPVIVFLHGGGWRVGSKDEGKQVVDVVTGAGYALVSVDYRLSGEAIFPAQIQDCKTAVRWVRAHAGEYGLDPTRVGAMGFSAGGHLAALLGTSAGVEALEGRAEGSPRESSRVQAVCDVSGPVDLSLPTHSIIGTLSVYGELGDFASKRPALVHEANPATYITGKEPPFLIIQGDQDKLVVPKHAEVLAAALRARRVPVELVTVQGGGHVPFDPEQADTTIKFFERRFRKK